MGNDQRKINNSTFAMILSVAIFIDLVEIFLDFIFIGLVLNILIDVLAGLTFYLWFKMKGVNFSSSKNFLTMAGGFFVGLIPFVNMLPEWSVAVFLVVSFSRAEELATKAGIPPAIAGKIGGSAGKTFRKAA